MDSSPSGSFIPKRNVVKPNRVAVGQRIYIFTYIAYTFFFGTLLVVVGVFLLNQQAERRLTEIVVQVDKAQKDFNRAQIAAIVSLDQRLTETNKLLNSQIAVSKIFDLLEPAIIQSVQLTSFTYTKSASAAVMNLTARGANFDTVLAQRQALAASAGLAGATIETVLLGEGASNPLGDGRAGVSRATESSITFSIVKPFTVADLAYEPRSGVADSNFNDAPASSFEAVDVGEFSGPDSDNFDITP